MTASLECRCGGKEWAREWATLGKEWASRQTSGNSLGNLPQQKSDLQNISNQIFCTFLTVSELKKINM